MASTKLTELRNELDAKAHQKSQSSNQYHVQNSSVSAQHYYPRGFLRKCFSQVVEEMISTFLLVFVTYGSAALSESDEHKVSKLGDSIAGGLIVTSMIYAVGHISGAHMNPAVTVAFDAVRHFPWKQVPIYALAQLTGSISASFTLFVLLHPIKHVGTTSPSGTDIQALITEIVMTFSMVFITSAVATDTKAVTKFSPTNFSYPRSSVISVNNFNVGNRLVYADYRLMSCNDLKIS